MKIKDLLKIERPREKLEKYGVKKLTEFELLAILFGSGIEGLNVIQLSNKILDTIQKIGIKKIKEFICWPKELLLSIKKDISQ